MSEDVAARFERRWALLVGAVILLLLFMIIFTAAHWSSMPPSRVEVIDSTTLHRGGEFVESNLGTAVDDDGREFRAGALGHIALHPMVRVVAAMAPRLGGIGGEDDRGGDRKKPENANPRQARGRQVFTKHGTPSPFLN